MSYPELNEFFNFSFRHSKFIWREAACARLNGAPGCRYPMSYAVFRFRKRKRRCKNGWETIQEVVVGIVGFRDVVDRIRCGIVGEGGRKYVKRR